MALESRKGKTPVQPSTAATKTVGAVPVAKAPVTPAAKHVSAPPLAPLFHKSNYVLMMVGAAVIALGMFLMAGGQNEASQFDYNKVYGSVRITVAPLLILIGFVIEIVAIFRRPSQAELAPAASSSSKDLLAS